MKTFFGRQKFQGIFLWLGILSLCFTFACTEKEKGKSMVKLENDDAKALYAMGSMYVERLDALHLTQKEIDTIVAGILKAPVEGAKPEDVKLYKDLIPAFGDKKIAESSLIFKKQGQDYIAEFMKKGGKKTDSGLAYRIITPGSNEKPTALDTVEVHYHGTFIDGSVFDSSVDRHEKAKFPLNAVIKGWTEGLQLIGEGGKLELVVPSDLAYGDKGSPPVIPGGSTLIFEVELFKIERAAKK